MYCSCGNKKAKGPNSKCHACYFQDKLIRVRKKAYSITGLSCWYCGYSKGEQAIPVLEFHHVDPTQKEIELSTREIVGYRWSKVLTEIQKCVMLCCRCHREYHCGLISDDEIQTIFKKEWNLRAVSLSG